MSGGTVSPDERGAMLRVETKHELRDGRTLCEGEVILTVEKVKGESVTGWFRPEWWDDDIARALVLDTPCEFRAYDEEDIPLDENGWFLNTLGCRCSSCLITDGGGDAFPYDDRWWGDGATVTVILPRTKAKSGDHIVVGGLFVRERLEGSDDRHGITSGLSSTTYCGSVSWDEWRALEAWEAVLD